MDKIAKFLVKLTKKERLMLKLIVDDIYKLQFEKYEIKPLKGYKNVYRLKKGKIRIIFYVQNEKSTLIDIDFRKDVYKTM